MEDSQKELMTEGSHNFEPAPIFKRSIAFAMDFFLLILLLQLLVHLFPNLYPEKIKTEFYDLLSQASAMAKSEQMDSKRMQSLLADSNLSPATYEMLLTLFVTAAFLPILYFYFGDAFFRGQTLGKTTFKLSAISLKKDSPPNHIKLFLRSVLKGLASLLLISPFMLPGLLNFFFSFFNKRRRCIHDYIGGTVTIYAENLINQNPEQKS